MKGFKDFLPLILGSLFVILVFVLFWNYNYLHLAKLEDRGSFGDSFGVVNTLFSGLAFAGIIAALFMQRRELKLQREDLELTRNELKKSATAQDSTQRALQVQVAIMAKQALLRTYSEKLNHNTTLLVNASNISRAREQLTEENDSLLKDINRLIQELERLQKGININNLYRYKKS